MRQKKLQKPTKAFARMHDLRNNKIIDILLLGFFVLFIIFFTTSKLTNEDDYFWHLATGRYIVQNHSIPTMDVFSYPTEGQQWLVTEWGWDVLTYCIFNAFSYAGLSILNTFVYLILFGVYFLILRKCKINYTFITLFSILLVFGVFERLTPRPHIISYLFMVVLIGFIMNYKYLNRKNYRKLYFIPFIFLIWGNMHMGCLIGLAILVIFVIIESIIHLKPGIFSTKEILPFTRNELLRLLIILILSCIALLINPRGIYTYYYSLISQANAKAIYESVMEWISPFNPRVTGKFHNNIYIFFLVGSILIFIYSIKKKDLFAGILCLLFVINSTRALRFTVDFQFVSFPFFILSINFLVSKIKNLRIQNFLTIHPASKLVLILFMSLLMVMVPDNRLYHHYLQYARFAGIGLDENYYPVKMFDFIKENKIQEIGNKPFNTFECGGFYIWNFPGQKDFFDSRDLNDFIMNEYQTLISKLPGYENKIKSYDFEYAICVIPDIAADPQLMRHTIISYFSEHHDTWKLVFWNDHSLLFVKNLPKFSDIITRYEYKYITPYNFYFQKNMIEKGLSDDKNEVLEEVDRKHHEDPNSIFLNNILVVYRKKML